MGLLEWKIFTRIAQRKFSYSVAKKMDVSSTIDGRDIGRFEELSQSASEWMDERKGCFKALHSFNRLRVPWIASSLSKKSCTDNPLKGLRLVDVGCGGGLLSMSLCRLGAEVVGLDASTSAIKVAELTASRTLSSDQCSRLLYVASSVEAFSQTNAEDFDGVIASEIVEHVNDLQSFLHHCVKLGKSDSRVPLFFTTINKTLMSKLLAVWMAENVLSIVPRGVHDWEKFVEPETLKSLLLDEKCRSVSAPLGISYNPFSNSWSWSSCHQINYAIKAIKN